MQSIHAETTPLTLSPAAIPTPVKGGFDFMGLMPLALIFVVFYFLVFRPQQQKLKQQKNMLGSLQRGDRVITEGGLMGTVNKIVSDKELAIEIAEGVIIRVVRSAVINVVSKTGGALESKEEDKGAKSVKAAVHKVAPKKPSNFRSKK